MDSKFTQQVRVGRYKISYIRKGSGVPLVFLHGFLNSSFTFRYVIDNFSLTNKVIVPDLPGSGDSSKPEKYDYKLNSLADFLENFFDSLNLKKLILCGVSTGGALALQYTVSYPSRLRKLIIVDSFGLEPSKKQKQVFEKPLDALKIYRKQFHLPSQISKDDQDQFSNMVNNKAVLHSAQKMLSANRQFIVKDIDKIEIPTLIIWGERDKILSKKTAEKFVQKIPNSRYVMIPEAGHLPHEESPEDFTLVLHDFLKDSIPRTDS